MLSIIRNFKPRRLNIRLYSDNHPIKKTLSLLSEEIPAIFGKHSGKGYYPQHCDVVIIGAGPIGLSIAYWLKTRGGKGLSIVVLEKDYTFKQSLNYLSFDGINQHFSLPENLLLSQYSAEFLRDSKTHLGKDVDIRYSPHGSLVVANDKYAEMLEQHVTWQRENGVKNVLLGAEKLKEKYPWMNVDGITLGCIGSESEGWFDPWALQKGLMFKAQELGTIFVSAEVTGFHMVLQRDVLMEGVEAGSFRKIYSVNYRGSDGEEYSIKFAACILAAGVDSGEIAKLANIGVGNGLLTIPLPVEPRKNRVYCLESSNNTIGMNMPLIKDVNGTWIRRNGFDNKFICGHAPLVAKDKAHDLLSDEEYYKTLVEPAIHHRLPALKDAKLALSKSEVCDCNMYDESGIIGSHPYHNNFYFATGFGNKGIEHAPGIGRAVAELIIDGDYVNIDLTRFGFDRLLVDHPVVEVNSY